MLMRCTFPCSRHARRTHVDERHGDVAAHGCRAARKLGVRLCTAPHLRDVCNSANSCENLPRIGASTLRRSAQVALSVKHPITNCHVLKTLQDSSPASTKTRALRRHKRRIQGPRIQRQTHPAKPGEGNPKLTALDHFGERLQSAVLRMPEACFRAEGADGDFERAPARRVRVQRLPLPSRHLRPAANQNNTFHPL